MSSDLVTSFQLESKLRNKIVTVKELNNCDSFFIISDLIKHWIKIKEAVIIISTHNSLKHYKLVGMKMNFNMNRSIDSGDVVFLNLGDEVFVQSMFNKEYSLTHFISSLQNHIMSLQRTHQSINIIIDGISHLFDLNFDLKSVNSFCNDILKLSRCIDNSIVLFHCNVASSDDVTSTLANLLSHKSSTICDVEHLQSGLSTDVSGHLIIKHPGTKFQEEHWNVLEQKPIKYLFKLFDKGVKLFAPGTV